MAVSSLAQEPSVLTVTCNVTATARLNGNSQNSMSLQQHQQDMPIQNCMFPNDVNDFNYPVKLSSTTDQRPVVTSQCCVNRTEIPPDHGYTCSSFNEETTSSDMLQYTKHRDHMFHWLDNTPHKNVADFQHEIYTTGSEFQHGHMGLESYDVNHHTTYANFQDVPVTLPHFVPNHPQYPQVNQVNEYTELLDLNSTRLGDEFSKTFSWNHQQNLDVHNWGNERRNESEPDAWIEPSNSLSHLENHQQHWSTGSQDFSTDSSSSNYHSCHESDDVKPGNKYNTQCLFPIIQETDNTQTIRDPMYFSSNGGQPAAGTEDSTIIDKNKRCDKIKKSEGGESETPSSAVDVDHLISSGVMVAGYKPRNIIRKRSKTNVPRAGKDNWYWEKRRKNNESARRSREMKKEKEKDFYRRALELEYENFFLKERIGYLETQLSCPRQPSADLC